MSLHWRDLKELQVLSPCAQLAQCFGRKKTAVAVALVRTGSGQVRLNGCPLHTVKPDILRVKALTFDDFCMQLCTSHSSSWERTVAARHRVKDSSSSSSPVPSYHFMFYESLQCFTSCAAIAKGIVAYFQKYIDEASKKEIKDGFRSSPESLGVSGNGD
eukprot:Skav223226  [mRNA]  locus=scaffold2231:183899:184874:+ [translate_table: standard]